MRRFEQTLGKPRAGHGHTQRSGASAVLSLDDLIAAVLYAVDEAVEILAFERVAGLRKKRDNSGAAVATDNGNVLIGRVGAFMLRDKAGGADYIESGDAKEALRVVDAAGFEDLGCYGDSGVDLGIAD